MGYDTNPEVRSLISRIRSGDKNAFCHFIRQYQRLVGHVVYRMITNQTDREDLCQDIFIKIYSNLSAFRFECKISTWIAKIAYHTCINHLKKRKIPLLNDCYPDHESFDDFTSDTLLPDSETERNETEIRIKEEIAQLPIQYRAVLTLYHLEEMSYAEIGNIMEMPEGTVKNYLFRARKQLKEKVLLKYQKEEILS